MHCGIIIEKRICGGQSEDAVRQVWCQLSKTCGTGWIIYFHSPTQC